MKLGYFNEEGKLVQIADIYVSYDGHEPNFGFMKEELPQGWKEISRDEVAEYLNKKLGN